MNHLFTITLSLFALLISPSNSFAQYHSSTSMELITNSNAHAKDCFRAASIAARIHYTSRKELEACSFALTYTSMSLRDRAATLANRGIIYMAMEDYERAIQDYSTAIKLRPEFGEIYVNIGNVYYMGRIFDKAIVEYTSAIEKKTSKAHIAHLNRGMAYESLGDFVNAEADYKAAQVLLPEWGLPQIRLDELAKKRNSS